MSSLLVRIPRTGNLAFVGRHGGEAGFVASVVVAGAPGRRAWFAVLHRFDGDGHHVGTQVFRAGAEADPAAPRLADEQRQTWVRQLSTLLLGPIDVEPFTHVEQDVTFGIVADGDGFRLVPEDVPVQRAG